MEAQLKKGTLELITLSFLTKKDYYGYQMAQLINEHIPVKEGTIYLILQRLEKNKILDSYTEIINNGKKRKYYKISQLGIEKYNSMIIDWKNITNIVNNVIGGSYE